VSPADIAATAEFRAGLYSRLAELGLVPPEPAAARVATLPDAPTKPADEARKAA
jgi:hypothetical protein